MQKKAGKDQKFQEGKSNLGRQQLGLKITINLEPFFDLFLSKYYLNNIVNVANGGPFKDNHPIDMIITNYCFKEFTQTFIINICKPNLQNQTRKFVSPEQEVWAVHRRLQLAAAVFGPCTRCELCGCGPLARHSTKSARCKSRIC